MSTVDELREVLEERAGVPEITGVVEAARAGATRVRRRRRITAATVTAGLVVVAAVAVPVTVQRMRATDPLPAAPATKPYRQTGEYTVRVQPAPRYFVLQRQVEAAGQVVVIRSRNSGDRDWGGTVTVHDPGTYDPAWLRTGERITVDGHPAFYTLTVTSRPTGPAPEEAVERARMLESEGVAVIGWPDPSGAWVTVTGGRTRADVQRLAESVELGAPRPITAPVQFSWVPGGLRLGFVSANDQPAGSPILDNGARVGFTAKPLPAALEPGSALANLHSDMELTVLVLRRTDRSWTEMVDPPQPPGVAAVQPRWRTVAGHRTWYLPPGSPHFAAGSAHLLIEDGECGIALSVDESVRISYDDLVRTVAGMPFADCTDPATWLPVQPR